MKNLSALLVVLCASVAEAQFWTPNTGRGGITVIGSDASITSIGPLGTPSYTIPGHFYYPGFYGNGYSWGYAIPYRHGYRYRGYDWQEQINADQQNLQLSRIANAAEQIAVPTQPVPIVVVAPENQDDAQQIIAERRQFAHDTKMKAIAERKAKERERALRYRTKRAEEQSKKAWLESQKRKIAEDAKANQ